MTTIHSEQAVRSPSTTAPPRPPTGSSRWMTATGNGQSCAASSIASGVPSVESSTNSTSHGSLDGTDSVSCRSNSRTFAASLNVGMMTVTAPGSATAVDSSSTSPSSPVPRGGTGKMLIVRLPRRP